MRWALSTVVMTWRRASPSGACRVWAVTGFGYFSPVGSLAGWGVLLGLDIWSVYARRPITDEDLERELRTGL
jgi:hypothetical protein